MFTVYCFKLALGRNDFLGWILVTWFLLLLQSVRQVHCIDTLCLFILSDGHSSETQWGVIGILGQKIIVIQETSGENNGHVDIPYLFGYKAQHFFYENLLVHSKSVLNLGCVLLPSVFTQQNLTEPVRGRKGLYAKLPGTYLGLKTHFEMVSFYLLLWISLPITSMKYKPWSDSWRILAYE